MLKYQEHLILYPNCKYTWQNPYGNAVWVDSLNEAINRSKLSKHKYHKYGRDKCITICIYNPNIKDNIIRNWSGSGWESMKLSKYAEYRFIYINLDKTQIFGEEFSVIVSDNGLTTEYFYDYDLLFGGEGYPKQFKTKNDAGYDIFALMPSRYIDGSKYRYNTIKEYMNSIFNYWEKVFGCYVEFDMYYKDEDEFLRRRSNIKKRFPIRNKTVPYKK